MTGRESVEQKAARYLTEGRIVVTRVLGDTVDTVCQGTAGSYEPYGRLPAVRRQCKLHGRRPLRAGGGRSAFA